jgi:hypothetical protein
MIKKLLSGLFILALLGAGVGYYLFAGKTDGQKAGSAVLAMKEVTSKAAVGVAAVGQTVMYGDQNAKIYSLSVASEKYTELPTAAYNFLPLVDVLWPQTGGDYIAVSKNSGSLTYSHFNSQNKRYTQLSDRIAAMDWLPNGRQVALIWRTDDNRGQLVISGPDATGYQVLNTLPWNDLNIRVSPDGTKALIVRQTQSNPVNKIYLFDLSDGSYETVVNDGLNLDAKWVGPTQFVFSQKTASAFSKIQMYDTASKTVTDLGLDTPIERVAGDSANAVLYAATNRADGGDDFISIKMGTFEKQQYFSPQERIKVAKLTVASGKLLFTGLPDSKLYIIN